MDGVERLTQMNEVERMREIMDVIMDRLNNRPRKCLGFKTPNQLFSGIKPPVALTS